MFGVETRVEERERERKREWVHSLHTCRDEPAGPGCGGDSTRSMASQKKDQKKSRIRMRYVKTKLMKI